MKKRKSFHSQVINAVITAIVRMLMGWAEEWGNDAFFFLIIGDKQCTDVAWHNTENLACEGALALTGSGVECAAAFQDLASSFDILIDEELKADEAFEKKFAMTSPSKKSHGWCSMENEGKEEGGAQ